jgi:hypothetical protein
MGPVQVWLVDTLSSATTVANIMHTKWGWPSMESLHFIGLTLLFGSIAAWDLRLLGVARRVPIVAFHRLIPFAVLGFTINAATGSTFLMTEPDQYIYNPAFHLKLLFLTLAGVNVLVFYVTVFAHVKALGPDAEAPPLARVNGALSLIFWLAVIVCGRMLTFYRPVPCGPGDVVGFLANCILR